MTNLVAKSTDGTIFIQYKGSNTSSPAFMIIKKNGNVTTTYNMKDAGVMTAGMELSRRIKKAVNQKYDNNNRCEVSEFEASSIKDAYKIITNIEFIGSFATNAIN